MSKVIFVFSMLFFSFHAFSETVECRVGSVAKCMCAAPMQLKCANGAEGMVKADAPLKYIKLVVVNRNGMKREVTLQDPPGGIREYYVPKYNQWVTARLGAKADDEITVASNGYGVDSGTDLYYDYKAETKPFKVGDSKNKVKTEVSGGESKEQNLEKKEKCFYVDTPPMIVEYSKGCKYKMCKATIKCTLPTGDVISGAICPALGEGECPSATECAMDNEVKFSQPVNNSQLKVFDSKSGERKTKIQ